MTALTIVEIDFEGSRQPLSDLANVLIDFFETATRLGGWE